VRRVAVVDVTPRAWRVSSSSGPCKVLLGVSISGFKMDIHSPGWCTESQSVSVYVDSALRVLISESYGTGASLTRFCTVHTVLQPS
jgi:hypothetical protein